MVQKKEISMDAVMRFLNEQSKAVSKRDILKHFKVRGSEKDALRQLVKKMRHDGVLEGHRQMKIVDSLPQYVAAEITGVDDVGELIARPVDVSLSGKVPQILITKDRLKPLVGVGDLVRLKVRKTPDGYEGETIRRLSSNENHMVCVYQNGFARSVDRRFQTPFKVTQASEPLNENDLLIVDIPSSYSAGSSAKFVRRIGSADDACAATLIAIYLHHLPVAFSKETEKEVAHLTVPPVSKTHKDMRGIPFVTIDGEDARDFDDAVWAEPDQDPKNSEGWHAMIAIADVGWYVRPGTALDHDAFVRGNSVYFPDRALPMLPEELSGGVCSLKPGEDRAAVVCEVWVDKNGYEVKHCFHRALIRSVRCLTYTQVEAALTHEKPLVGLEERIEALLGIYRVLEKRRKARGALEIDIPERQVVLDKKGQVLQIKSRERLVSMQIIEELMILANVVTAVQLEEKEAPVMYRVHDRPSEEKVMALNEYLSSLGRKGQLKKNPDPSAFNALMSRHEGTFRYFGISEYVLRAQSQAKYSPENIGHFGLALAKYAHFTSPIRRYADLVVHRSLVRALKLGEGGLTEDGFDYFEKTAEHISATERRAASAESDAIDRYVASYFKDKIGSHFMSRIISITSFGMFVRLKEYQTDGYVPIRFLSDFYQFDETTQSLISQAGHQFKVGQKLKVILKDAAPVTGGLIFFPVFSAPTLKKKKND